MCKNVCLSILMFLNINPLHVEIHPCFLHQESSSNLLSVVEDVWPLSPAGISRQESQGPFSIYRQTSNISNTLIGNKIVYHSDVVGASLRRCSNYIFILNLTHWGRDTMAAIFQTFSNGFSWMKMYKFRLRFHRSLFLMVHLTIFQHWFR